MPQAVFRRPPILDSNDSPGYQPLRPTRFQDDYPSQHSSLYEERNHCHSPENGLEPTRKSKNVSQEAKVASARENRGISKKPKRPNKRVAQLSKRQVYDDYFRRVIPNGYSKCACDLISHSHGFRHDMETLFKAEAAGRVTKIIDEVGRSSTHLYSCESNPYDPEDQPFSYDSKTIARDILRAEGIHPFLPALNERFVKKAQREEKEYWKQYEVYSQARRTRKTCEQYLDWDPLNFGRYLDREAHQF